MGSLMTLVGSHMLRSKNASWTNRHETKNGCVESMYGISFGEGEICLCHFFSNRQSAKKTVQTSFFRARKFSPTNLFIRKNMACFWMGDLLLTITGTIFVRRVPVAWASWALYLKFWAKVGGRWWDFPPETNSKSTVTNGWLQDDPFGASFGLFSGAMFAC